MVASIWARVGIRLAQGLLVLVALAGVVALGMTIGLVLLWCAVGLLG